MKKYSLLQESSNNKQFIDDFKNVIYDMFDKNLNVFTILINDIRDSNDIYIYTLHIKFKNALCLDTYLEYKKLFDVFYEYELDFNLQVGNSFYSNGLLSDLYDVYEKFNLELQSKKYNL